MSQQLARLREEAIALRRQGRSRREIKEMLRIGSNQTLNEALRGEPPLPSTWRPNAKDDLHAKARELRQQGHAYNEIAAALGVSKSSVSLWVRDIPRPERLSYEECAKRAAAGVAAYWLKERPRREEAKVAVSDRAARQIGGLSDREILIAGAVAYWCEGAKNKPHRRYDRIDFINSDPRLIKFFLRFLATAGVREDRIVFQIHIHETADLASAERFWRDTIGVEGATFNRALIKRHRPRTVRKNTGQDYHGCLRVQVRRSADVYRRIAGWASAVMTESPVMYDPNAIREFTSCAAPPDPGSAVS
jgi:transcriptional regulator with XRE-family HTH domain